jgi:hypothetical protein
MYNNHSASVSHQLFTKKHGLLIVTGNQPYFKSVLYGFNICENEPGLGAHIGLVKKGTNL